MNVRNILPGSPRNGVAVLAAGLLLGLSSVALAQTPYEDPGGDQPPNTPFNPPANPSFTPPPETAPDVPAFIRPFPVVRIKGWLTRRGARVTRLSVTAPAGTEVDVRCRRRGCPKRAVARTARVLRFRAFERKLPAGVRLIVTATSPGLIGKHVSIRIRRGRAPKRRDRCLAPGETQPIACSQEVQSALVAP